MTRIAVPFPVLPGKGESDIHKIAERFKAKPRAYRESRRNAGITLERAYWQHTPMGDFVVAYVESNKSPAETLAAMGQDTSELGRWFVETVKEVHGVDISQPPAGPPPETIGEWVDSQVKERRRGMAFSAPLIPGTEDIGRSFTADAFRQDGMTRSRRAIGDSIEVVTISHSPQGPVAAVYIEGDDPFAANAKFAVSNDPFDVWFREQLKTIFPPFIDFSQPVPGITEIFDSEALPAR
jgi:hypothetical protein